MRAIVVMLLLFALAGCAGGASFDSNGGAPPDSRPSTSDESIGQTSQALGAHWCAGQSEFTYAGDFNGDGRADLLCYNRANGTKWLAYANDAGNFDGSLSWHYPLAWCGSSLYVGDFDGNGRMDMLCHDIYGHNWIALTSLDGWLYQGGIYELPFDWCGEGYTTELGALVHNQLTLGDFNGDHLTDLMCTEGLTGHMWIMYAYPIIPALFLTQPFYGTSWEAPMDWCHGSYGGGYISNFNLFAGRLTSGDQRDDLFCGQGVLGSGVANGNWQLLADSAGQFTKPPVGDFLFGWCNWPREALFHGDVNGDGLTDLICSNRANHHMWVGQAPFTAGVSPTTWHAEINWCMQENETLDEVADFNGDGHVDLLCKAYGGANGGEKWIAYAKQMPDGAWGYTGTDWHSF